LQTTHDYAYRIEVTVKVIFKCNEYELGGITDANFIEKDPFIAIAFVLGNFYNKVDRSFEEKIDEFLNVYYLDMGKAYWRLGRKG